MKKKGPAKSSVFKIVMEGDNRKSQVFVTYEYINQYFRENIKSTHMKCKWFALAEETTKQMKLKFTAPLLQLSVLWS